MTVSKSRAIAVSNDVARAAKCQIRAVLESRLQIVRPRRTSGHAQVDAEVEILIIDWLGLEEGLRPISLNRIGTHEPPTPRGRARGPNRPAGVASRRASGCAASVMRPMQATKRHQVWPHHRAASVNEAENAPTHRRGSPSSMRGPRSRLPRDTASNDPAAPGSRGRARHQPRPTATLRSAREGDPDPARERPRAAATRRGQPSASVRDQSQAGAVRAFGIRESLRRNQREPEARERCSVDSESAQGIAGDRRALRPARITLQRRGRLRVGAWQTARGRLRTRADRRRTPTWKRKPERD